EFAKILIDLRLRKLLEQPGGMRAVDIAQRHDIFAFQLLDVFPALSAHTDAGDVQLFIRRRRSPQSEHMPGNNLEHRAAGGSAEHKLAPRNPILDSISFHDE